MKYIEFIDFLETDPPATGWYLVKDEKGGIWKDWWDQELKRFYNPQEESDYTCFIYYWAPLP